MNEMEKLRLVLQLNKKKDFVKRILYKERSPELPDGEGGYKTHVMEHVTTDKGAMLYPTVVRKKGDKHLTELKYPDSVKYAEETGEYIEFPEEKYAEWFADNYKKLWPTQKSNKGK